MMIELLNDKSDGFMDDLLPLAEIRATEVFVGCVSNLTMSGFQNIDSPVALIGPACSTDVAEITTSSFRDNQNWRGVVISPSSTAPSIANDTQYPNAARLSTSETKIQEGLKEIANYFGWKKNLRVRLLTTQPRHGIFQQWKRPW